MIEILGLLLFSASALAPAENKISSDMTVTKEYRKCLRAHSKGKLDSNEVRYNDDLFKSSLEKCVIKLPVTATKESPVEKMHRSTQIYIATLKVLNSFPRPRKEDYDPSIFVSAPTSPPQESDMGSKKLDGFTQGDFAVLYTPWLYCLASEMQNKGTGKPEEFIKTANQQCEKVDFLADSEALSILDSVGGYGNAESQQKVLSDFKAIGSQMVVLSALRADGENLGAALKRSEQVVK